MLIFNLKKEWYEKIRSGEKTIEYREVKPYWNTRIKNEVCRSIGNNYITTNRLYYIPMQRCILRLGYTKRHMTAEITRIEVVDGKDTDLAIDAPVYAIHLANVREG